MSGSVQQLAAKQRTDVPALLWHFFNVYRARTLTVVALLTIAGLAEGVSALALLPFAQIALSDGGGHAGHAWQWISRGLALIDLTPSVGSLLTLIVIGVVLKAAVSLLAMKEVGYAVSRMMTDLRQRLISALMEAKWSYFVARPLGLFSNAISAESIRAGNAYQQAARLAAAFIQTIVYAVVTVVVSWKIAILAVIAGTAGLAMFRRVVAVAYDAGKKQTNLMQSVSVRTTDTLMGIKPIKAMAAEKSAIPLLDREILELDEAQRSQVWSAEFLRLAQEPLLVVFLAVGVYAAVNIGGESLPKLMVIAVLFYRLFNRFQIMQEIYQQIGIGVSAYWSIYQLCLDTERESERRSGVQHSTGNVPNITLDSVSFNYGGKDALYAVSTRIEPGEFIAISGPSGGGKTTLLDIVSGLLSPASGRLLVDGHHLADLDLYSWRQSIGYVPQEMLLLHDTIYRNVSLGDPKISRAQAEEALRAAGIWDVVADLPDGLDTIVGERGSRFSGGERQRISIARALARQPSVLLLDEITASLDEATELAVCATLRRLAGKMTIIAVSHQRTLARVSDRVLRLENGRLCEAQFDRDVGVLNLS
jgi:ATP-binding cassette subfamily C protein